jgi:hypothetical protein
LRDTARDGGHGGAWLIGAREQVPVGFHPAGNVLTIARSWSPSRFDPGGMVRWWLERTAWQTPVHLDGKVAVED